ncbi:hypothetical protein DESC_270014 [Desulfosarcina cetonica]|nr:hypothetical protein DESC_270014 [Desulfosarcina cetonica]
MHQAGHVEGDRAYCGGGRSVGHEVGQNGGQTVAGDHQGQPGIHSQGRQGVDGATGQPVGRASLVQGPAKDDGAGIEPDHAPVDLFLVVTPVDDAGQEIGDRTGDGDDADPQANRVDAHVVEFFFREPAEHHYQEDDHGHDLLAIPLAHAVDLGLQVVHGRGQGGDGGLEAPVDHEPGDRDHEEQIGETVGDPLEIADVHAEHVGQVGHHDDVAGAARRGAGAADVTGHGNGNHQHLTQFGIAGRIPGKAVLVKQHADGQEHGRQGVVGNKGRQGRDDHNENQRDPAYVGNGQFFEHHQAGTFVHPGFHKGGGKHQAAHDEPAGVIPIEHGHLLAGGNPGEHEDQADTEGDAGQRDALGEKTEHHEDAHGHRYLDEPGALVGFGPILVRQLLVFEAILAQGERGLHHLEIVLVIRLGVDKRVSLLEIRFIGLDLVLLAPLEIPLEVTIAGQGAHVHVLFHDLGGQQLPLRGIAGGGVEIGLDNISNHRLGTDAIFGSHVLHPVGSGHQQ